MVQFDGTLRSYGFTGTLYASQTSSIGRNPTEILAHLGNLAGLSEANDISSDVDKYPIDTVLYNGDALAMMKTIASLARIGIKISGTDYSLVYLSEKPAAFTTIAGADVIKQSADYLIGNEVVTEAIGSYQLSDIEAEQQKLIIRNNIDKHGLYQEAKDYFIYKDRTLVEKSVQFDIIRKSQQWKRFTFKTTAHKWGIEPFDVITIDASVLNKPDALSPSGDIDCFVESISINPVQGTAEVTVNTTMIAGTTEAYEFFWPKAVDGTFVSEERVEVK